MVVGGVARYLVFSAFSGSFGCHALRLDFSSTSRRPDAAAARVFLWLAESGHRCVVESSALVFLLGQLVVAVVAGLAHAPIVAETRTQRVEARASGTVSLETLPALEKRVYQLIWQGGPFPYVKDGMVFANRERLLPPKTRGFYREYTVASPHARTRGARRFVCGGPRRSPEVCYYTADHYASFQKIVP